MIEKVNPKHPDKLADRIAGAIVDMAYKKCKEENTGEPKIAVEVLVGHGECNVIIESSETLDETAIKEAVNRITESEPETRIKQVPQDKHLANNQAKSVHCGDNGTFKGMPVTDEEQMMSEIARYIYLKHGYDGKYIVDGKRLIVCQSNASNQDLMKELNDIPYIRAFDEIIINPLGEWTGGIEVDSGATNRKLGSDMAQSVTGGGLHGKDLSKADVSVNIYAFIKAQQTGKPVQLSCAIGDDIIDGKPYSQIVDIAREYIESIGGFEKFAEWGLF